MGEVYFFGCFGAVCARGHAWYSEGMRSVIRADERGLPSNRIDGGFAPRRRASLHPAAEEDQGQAILVHNARWTIVQFWDRSGDSRPNSNSSFVVEGHHTFDEVMAEARRAFPKLFDRFPFEIRLFRA